jgi:hypothetical protein
LTYCIRVKLLFVDHNAIAITSRFHMSATRASFLMLVLLLGFICLASARPNEELEERQWTGEWNTATARAIVEELEERQWTGEWNTATARAIVEELEERQWTGEWNTATARAIVEELEERQWTGEWNTASARAIVDERELE